MKRIALSLAILILVVGTTVLGCPGDGSGGGGGNGGGNGSTPPPSSAAFLVSNLTIEPAEVTPNEIVAVSVRVTNTGGSQGTHNIVLDVNGVRESDKSVILAAGESENVTFYVSRESIEAYEVSVGSLSGSFSVIRNILFSDNFSTETSGWEVFTYGADWAAYKDGWFHISDSSFSLGTNISLLNRNFTDFIIEVDMKLIAGTDDNWQSVVFCYGGNSYYSAEISADGYYEMQLWVDGTLHELVNPTFSSHILQGQGVINSVHIEFVDGSLSLSVNGHLLAEVDDDTLNGGAIGLEVHALSGNFSEVAFDNLVVYAP